MTQQEIDARYAGLEHMARDLKCFACDNLMQTELFKGMYYMTLDCTCKTCNAYACYRCYIT